MGRSRENDVELRNGIKGMIYQTWRPTCTSRLKEKDESELLLRF